MHRYARKHRYKALCLAPLLLACLSGATTPPVRDDAPVKTVGIYVSPYYGDPTSDAVVVRVHPAYDRLLESAKPADIVKVRDAILADPGLVSPMTLMVLSIRFYDVGLRDDSVFWFYAAKARYLTYRDVINQQAMRTGIFDVVEDGMSGFVQLGGPVINGYAFCDIPKQIATLDRAIDWVEANPYQVLFREDFKPLEGDRAENLRASIAKQRAWAKVEHEVLADPAKLKELRETRAKNHMDKKYCW